MKRLRKISKVDELNKNGLLEEDCLGSTAALERERERIPFAKGALVPSTKARGRAGKRYPKDSKRDEAMKIVIISPLLGGGGAFAHVSIDLCPSFLFWGGVPPWVSPVFLQERPDTTEITDFREGKRGFFRMCKS